MKAKSVGISISGVGGEPLPTEKQFQDWVRSLEGMFPSRLKELEKAFTLKLGKAQSVEAKSEWKRRLTIVQERLLGGPVQDKAPGPVRVESKPALPFDQRKRLWEEAKKKSPLFSKQKAAGRTAA